MFNSALEIRLPQPHILQIKKANIFREYVFYAPRLHFLFAYTHVHLPSRKAAWASLTYLLQKPILVPQAAWIIDNWSEGYFHRLTDCLPRLWLLRKYTSEKYPVLLPQRYQKKAYVEASLQLLGMLYFEAQARVVVSDLLIPAHTAPHR